MEVTFYFPGLIDLIILSVLILGTALMFIFAAKRTIELIRLLRPFRIIHYAGFAAGGVVMGAVIGDKPLDIYLLFYIILAVITAFQAAVFLNDIFDAEIDKLAGKKTPFTKGIISIRASYILAAGLAVLSLLLALRCGLNPFLFLLAAHVISLLYSTPLVRLKRFYPLNVFLLALAGLAVMYSGFSSHSDFRLFPVRMLVLVLVTLTATFGTKDMADIEGDRERGIHTLFTLLGLKTGRWVNAALVLVAYLATPLILGYLKLYWAAVPAGVGTALVVLARKLREWIILLIYVLFGITILVLIALGEIF
ncbi:hypothetical protein GF359_06310 [candidate division WOR-3 bacterium]|uniref:Prenyltransferase n=1 Tax=candidate division WOR-3 bacterium TaxID=2052148 RepID=A0A9D5QD73_UNCW3|nr:hypothetical protein [candidate division WOR-3 bacterium]MBD3364812.1 hypothetical protein [candidate division WOR-3 bacterium]